MKKTLLAILLLMLLVLACLTACKGPEQPGAETTPAATTQDPAQPQNPPSQENPKITLKLHNETKTISANETGEYSLDTPSRIGFDFVGFKTADGKDFAASGKISENVEVIAVWKILETSTFEQLKARIEAGADTVLITKDIIISDTIYVVADTTISAKSSVTLTRDGEFLGDMFVIGETPDGKNVILSGKTASLSISPENTSITFDGDNISANGTAFLIANSSTLNINDGVFIKNMTKRGNDHITVEKDYNVSYPAKVGGAAVIVTNGTFNMYGGQISHCSVNNSDSTNTAKADRVDGYDNSQQGGAIYNYGTFNMYGGSIERNSAARGGAIYNYRTVKIYAGSISYNSASAYGGVMYMPNSQYTCAVIGSAGVGIDVRITNNTSVKSGGAIFGSHQSATDILGKTIFSYNSTSSNGGAINMAGSLNVNDTVFYANSASAKGGAIYAYYGDLDFSTRIVNINSATFTNNSATRGGAIMFSGDDSTETVKGAKGYIGDVLFISNGASKTSGGDHGNGGALHVALASKVTVSSGATFVNNYAEDKGAAIYLTSGAEVKIEGTDTSPVEFMENSSDGNGGAVYLYTDSKLVANNAIFDSNTSYSPDYGGGAIYLTGATAELSKVTINNNSAFKGGAIGCYSESTLTIKNSILFDNSSRDNGGVIYNSGSTVTAENSVFYNNSAEASGGVIAVHSGGTVNLYGSTFSYNTAGANGGAVYIYQSTATLGDNEHTLPNVFKNNSATENGGAIYVSTPNEQNATSTLNAHTIEAYNNIADGGGALYFTTNKDAGGIAFTNVSIKLLKLEGNVSNNNGGALYVYHYANVQIDELYAEGNHSYNYGGFAYMSGKSKTTINKIVATDNSALVSGGCIYMTTGDTEVTLKSGDIRGNYLSDTPDTDNAIYSNSAASILYIDSEALTYAEGSITGKDSFAPTELPTT